jgi:uncharacterized flavoprotein (TIGR03862 family)
VSRPVAAVIGAGPAGLRAAEILAEGGFRVTVFEQKRSLGRKFLVAGRGGLNITHSEPLDIFVTRYDAPETWRDILNEFPPAALRRWFESLGVPTFVGTSGRVFPRAMRASAVLEKWLERLEELEVEIKTNYRFHQLLGQRPFDLVFEHGNDFAFLSSDIVLFALGGGSWPQTGSDGRWVEQFREMGIEVRELVASNVGWERPWSPNFLKQAEGRPLKNVAVTCARRTVRGELLVTNYGLEGGALYQLSSELRRSPEISIDFKPDVTSEVLERRCQKAEHPLEEMALRICRLSPTAFALLRELHPALSLPELVPLLKACPVTLSSPRPIAEAISSGGGLVWNELDASLMLKTFPGVFCAGEMIDWDAPTGGYLLQGCFSTATTAARGALQWAKSNLIGTDEQMNRRTDE